MRRALFIVLALAQPGCSLTGLADFTIPACDPAACEELNAARGITDPCVRYHCAADALCRLQPVDLDGDGHATASCAGAEGCGSILSCDDCDDAAAAAFPGQVEVCDGADNDCNLIVDDVAAGGTPQAPVAVVTGTGDVVWHAYGAPLGDASVAPVAFGGTTDGFFNVVERDEVRAQAIGLLSGNLDELTSAQTIEGCPTDRIQLAPSAPSAPVMTGAGTCTRHEDCDDGLLCNGFELCDASAASADPVTGCTSGDDNEAPCPGAECNERLRICELGNLGAAQGCSFADLDAAELEPGAWFGAMAEKTGCGNVLRVGYFTEGAMDAMMAIPGRNLLFRGDVHRSTSFRGVDRVETEMGACTGRSRAEGEAFGARLPSIAALAQDPAADRRRPQALVAWLVPNASGGQPVEVIGIWQEQFGDPALKWINATGDGIPQRLESAAVGDVRPVVLAFTGEGTRTAGYLVAYGVAGGGIAVRFVRPFSDPDRVIEVSPYTTTITAGESTPRTSPPIADLGTEQLLATNGEATNVSLVIGRVEGDRAALGLAWHDADGIRLRTITLDAAAGTFDDAAPAQLVASAEPDELAVGYTPDAVVLPGFERDGATADETSSGGFLLAWRAGGTTRGARFAELDGQRIGEISTLGGDLRRFHIYPGSVANDAGSTRTIPRLIFHDEPSQEFRAQAFCGPAP